MLKSEAGVEAWLVAVPLDESVLAALVAVLVPLPSTFSKARRASSAELPLVPVAVDCDDEVKLSSKACSG